MTNPLSDNADIYRILNQSSLLNFGALKGERRSSFDLNPYTPLIQAIQTIAKSRHLPWEAVVINYAMLKGTLPLLQPTSREEMDRCHQAVGWRLAFNELTILDRVSLPLAFKPKSKSQQQLRLPMPLKRLLARPSKPNLKAHAATQAGKSPPLMSPHRISIDLPLQSLLASPPGNRKMSLTIEGADEEEGRWRADVTLSFIPSANAPPKPTSPFLAPEARPVAKGGK
ncbi:hypothetical protein DSO57_1008820 [Entomophthora muscae]|uniref:Uncharacterized protein n=1 Tax=Entomophthora muscae TaxID=34485 RepID=A0ACC2RLT5_9FUNG|nr:hypothetical protein DSO57_1008820 [Entomophthora muscae]